MYQRRSEVWREKLRGQNQQRRREAAGVDPGKLRLDWITLDYTRLDASQRWERFGGNSKSDSKQALHNKISRK